MHWWCCQFPVTDAADEQTCPKNGSLVLPLPQGHLQLETDPHYSILLLGGPGHVVLITASPQSQGIALIKKESVMVFHIL